MFRGPEPNTTRASKRRPRWGFAIFVSALALGAMVVHVRAGIAFLAPTLLAVLVLVAAARALVRWDDPAAERKVLAWTLAAFVVHLLVGVIVTSWPTARYYLATDSYIYDTVARDIVGHWNDGLPFPADVPGGKEGYYYLLAALYWLFGAHPVAGLVVNAAIAAAIIPLLTDATERLFGRDAARRVPPLVFFIPSFFLFTSQLMKEAAILFLLAVALNCGVRLTGRMAPTPLFALALSLSLLFTFRAWVALVAAQGLIVGIAFGKREVLPGLGTGISAAALLIVLVLPLGLGYSGYRAAVSADLEQASLVRRDLAVSANSGFAPEADVSTSGRALAYLPFGLVNFALGPFPWQVGGVRELPALLDVFVLWGLVPSFWRGSRAAWDLVRRRILVLVLPAATISVLLSLAIGNFGTVARERMQVVVLLIPLVAFGIGRKGLDREDQPELDAALSSR